MSSAMHAPATLAVLQNVIINCFTTIARCVSDQRVGNICSVKLLSCGICARKFGDFIAEDADYFTSNMTQNKGKAKDKITQRLIFQSQPDEWLRLRDSAGKFDFEFIQFILMISHSLPN